MQFTRLLVSPILLCCVGCSMLGLSSEEEAPKAPRELTKGDSKSPSTPQPELTLLKEAQESYNRGLYSIARESFNRIKNDYPSGAYAEYANIKAADCLFEQRDFRGAARAYEEILNNSSAKITTEKATALTSKHGDYLLYRAALSHKLLDPGSARDTSRLERSKEYFERLIAEAPRSPYVGLARSHLQEVLKSLAKNDLALLNYYEERNKKNALLARGKEFKTKYGVEPRRFESEEASKPEEPAENKPAVKPAPPLPDSVLSTHDASKKVESTAPQTTPPKNVLKKPAIVALTCDTASATAILEIGGDTSTFSESDVITVRDAQGIEIQSPVARRASKQGERSDCLGTRDLIITPRGEFTFLGADSVQVDTDSTPPRIIIGITPAE